MNAVETLTIKTFRLYKSVFFYRSKWLVDIVRFRTIEESYTPKFVSSYTKNQF